MKSDTPLFAAIEILLYGMLFDWSRNNQAALNYDLEIQPVLKASKLELCVLAPRDFYEGYNLRSLSTSLNRAFKKFHYRKDLELNFHFTQFNPNINSASDPEEIVAAIDARESIWDSQT